MISIMSYRPDLCHKAGQSFHTRKHDMNLRKLLLISVLVLPAAAQAQSTGAAMTGHADMAQHQGNHTMMMHGATGHGDSGPTEGGQAAFAAIQEIVAILMADPETDWSRVDIEALRQHLIDMDNVTMRAQVAMSETADGARFTVTSDDPDVAGSIRRMSHAHAHTMNGAGGFMFAVEDTDGGVVMTVTGDAPRIRALGFIGLMTVGAHHQQHHLALAQGGMPH